MHKLQVSIDSQEIASDLYDFIVQNELRRCTLEYDPVVGEYVLCSYGDDKKECESDFDTIRGAFNDLGSVVSQELKQSDWADEYKKSIKPWQCENLFWIPLHLQFQTNLPDNPAVVYIEPGMAFGTGTHETTRLCGRALVMLKNLYAKTGDLIIKTCIDVGCGSGILGISAIKLGFVHSTFIDIDPDAVRISQSNAQLNGLFHDQVTFVTGDIHISLLGRNADVILANILSDVLIKNADLLVSSIKPGGVLCLSGILKREKEEVAAVFRGIANHRWGSSLDNAMDDGQWSILLFFRV